MTETRKKGSLTTKFNIGDKVAVDYMGRLEATVQEIVPHPRTGEPMLMLGNKPDGDLMPFSPENAELIAPAPATPGTAPKP